MPSSASWTWRQSETSISSPGVSRLSTVIVRREFYPSTPSNRGPTGSDTSVGLSFMNVSLRNEGGFDEGRGNWLFTARRGFMDIVFGIADVDGDFHPVYYDLFGKVGYEVFPGHRMSARILHAGDDLKGSDDDDKSRHDDLYGSSYLWLTWDSEISETLSSRTTLLGEQGIQGPSRPGLRRRWGHQGTGRQ